MFDEIVPKRFPTHLQALNPTTYWIIDGLSSFVCCIMNPKLLIDVVDEVDIVSLNVHAFLKHKWDSLF